MSMVKLFCRNCGSDGHNGSGFGITTVMNCNCDVSKYEGNKAQIVSMIVDQNPIDMIKEASASNRIRCRNCNSNDVEVIWEVDLRMQEKQETIIDSIGDISTEFNVGRIPVQVKPLKNEAPTNKMKINLRSVI